MADDTTPQDSAAMSPASTGSLAWIPVGDRLPALHEHVIGWQQGWARSAEVWRGSKGQWLGGDFEPADEVSHWMPFPAPPTDAK